AQPSRTPSGVVRYPATGATRERRRPTATASRAVRGRRLRVDTAGYAEGGRRPTSTASSLGRWPTSTVSRPGVASSTAGELAVRDAVRAGGLGPEPLDLVLLVALEVALEPEPRRAALPGQDVRGDPVQEPPVVAGDHRAPGEVEQGVLQRRQRLH